MLRSPCPTVLPCSAFRKLIPSSDPPGESHRAAERVPLCALRKSEESTGNAKNAQRRAGIVAHNGSGMGSDCRDRRLGLLRPHYGEPGSEPCKDASGRLRPDW